MKQFLPGFSCDWIPWFLPRNDVEVQWNDLLAKNKSGIYLEYPFIMLLRQTLNGFGFRECNNWGGSPCSEDSIIYWDPYSSPPNSPHYMSPQNVWSLVTLSPLVFQKLSSPPEKSNLLGLVSLGQSSGSRRQGPRFVKARISGEFKSPPK